MNSISPKKSSLAASLLVLVSAAPLCAQTERVWSGATSANFGTTTNWSGGVAPGSTTNVTTATNTDIAVFDNAARAGDITLGGSRNLGGFKFTGPGVAAYNLGTGGTHRFNLTLGGEVSLDAGVTAAQSIQRLGLTGATGTYTFRNDAAGAAATLTAASTLLNYTTGAANLVLNGGNTGANAVVGVISENSGAGALALTKNGAGAWVLQGANTFTGGVTVNDGTLALRNNAALGVGTLTLAGGRIGSVVSARTIGNAISITGDIQLGGAAADTGLTATSTVFGGAVNLNGAARTLTLANSATFSGVISNGGLVVAATAPELGMTLGADNTFAGGTTMLGGRVITTHAGALGEGDVTINGGELRLFGDTAGVANLGAGANFAMSAGVWTVQLGTAFDQLVGAGGSFALSGGTINLDVTGTGFAYDQSYAILHGFSGGIVSGLAFSGYDTLGYQAVLSDGGLLSFAAIPEPSAYGVVAALFALGAVGVRRQKRFVA